MRAPHPESTPSRRRACVLLILLAALVPAPGQEPQDPARAGQRMYQDGILPSGQPMRSTGPGGDQARGTVFTCAGCHLRAGLGSADEQRVVPPINGPRLFTPAYLTFPFLTGAERADLPAAAREALRRPAYTEATLLTAIREGVDPAGHVLNTVMPRYPLATGDGATLVRYLRGLSSAFSPGVTATALRFATVVTEGVPKEDREAMLATMRQQVAIHNQVYEKNLQRVTRVTAMREMTLALRRWDLVVWELKGPAATWRAQLEAYDRAGPVFALIGGLADGPWLPVHAFCQDQGLPCILPLTEHPVVGAGDSPTLYFSGGFYQEGASAGERAAQERSERGGPPVLQVVQDSPAGRALARGFREALAREGHPEPQEVVIPAGGLAGPALADLLAARPGGTLVALWAGRETFTALAAAVSGAGRPPWVFMSASLLKEALWDLPQEARACTLLTYPYRLPKPPSLNQDPRNLAAVPAVAAAVDLRVRSRTYSLMQVVDEGVRGMGRHFYRVNFLDRIGLMDEKADSDYTNLSFTPGLPWLATVCNLVGIPKGSAHTFSTP